MIRFLRIEIEIHLATIIICSYLEMHTYPSQVSFLFRFCINIFLFIFFSSFLWFIAFAKPHHYRLLLYIILWIYVAWPTCARSTHLYDTYHHGISGHHHRWVQLFATFEILIRMVNEQMKKKERKNVQQWDTIKGTNASVCLCVCVCVYTKNAWMNEISTRITFTHHTHTHTDTRPYATYR